MTGNRKVILLAILVLAIVGGGIWWAYHKQRRDSQLVSGTVQAAQVQFGPRQGGRVQAVFVKEGQLLKSGDRILQLEAAELQSQKEAMQATLDSQKAYLLELENGTRPDQIAAAKATFERARADYELTVRGNRAEDIQSAKAAMEAAQSEMKRASSNAERKEALYREQLISKDQLEEAQKGLSVASKRFEEAKESFAKAKSGFRREEVERNLYNMRSQEATYRDLAKGTRPEKLTAERSRLQMYQAQLAEIDTRLNELRVVSPCNCELSEFEIEPGTLVLANQVLGTLINLDDLWVDAYLPSEAYGRVWPGDKVEISSFSYPGRKFQGKVRFVGLKAEFTPRNIQTVEGRKQEVFKVKVTINNSKRLFRPGMDLDLRFRFRKDV